jgi:hypothetical protein
MSTMKVMGKLKRSTKATGIISDNEASTISFTLPYFKDYLMKGDVNLDMVMYPYGKLVMA